jgi:drug/metabolite transporter (DMT)-like permease
VSGFGYLQVVVAASLGALVLHEPLRGTALLGISLVVGGGAFLAYASFRDARNGA